VCSSYLIKPKPPGSVIATQLLTPLKATGCTESPCRPTTHILTSYLFATSFTGFFFN